MTKMEALKDVKESLSSVINKLETYMFVQGIDDVRETKPIKQEKVGVEPK